MTLLGAAALLLLALTAGAALTTSTTTWHEAAPAAASRDVEGGLRADVGLAVSALGVEVARDASLDPSLARAAQLPGLTLRREVGLDQAPVGLALHVDVATGSHATRAASTSAQGGALTQTTGAQAPALAALAAATLAGAGLLAYFWTSVKTWGTKLLVLPLVPLYAHITRSEVFDNHVRERIFAAIGQEPGVCASELSRRTGVSWGTTIYHLEVLEQTRMVCSLRDGRYRRYFQNGAGLDMTKEAVATLRNPVTAKVAERVRAAPGVTQKALADAMSLSPQALHWHLARLVKAGLVEKRREGRLVRHFASA